MGGSPPAGDEAAQAEAAAWKDFHFAPAAAGGTDGAAKASMRPKNTLTYGSDRPSSIVTDPRLDAAVTTAAGAAVSDGASETAANASDALEHSGDETPSGAGVFPSPKKS